MACRISSMTRWYFEVYILSDIVVVIYKVVPLMVTRVLVTMQPG
jgi:hypothetical protein